MNFASLWERVNSPAGRVWKRGEQLLQPTLRTRLALYAGGLSLSLNLVLVLFINTFARALLPQNTVAFAQPLGPFVPDPTLSAAAYQSATANIQRSVLSELQLISIVGLVLITLLTGVGAYWLAGKTLRPLQSVSRAARHISANTLDRRLGLQGPDDEIKELGDAFDLMLEKLQRAFEQQSRFVGDAAHELRTPLATLRLNLDVVMANRRATLTDYHDVAVVFERTLVRLERLVDSLLILASDERDLVAEDVCLGPLLGEVVGTLEGLARERHVVLHLDCSADVRTLGDPLLLTRAFSNLVENGIRYNELEGTVTVTVRREDCYALVIVKDTGPGIAVTNQDRIFERFYRVEYSRARHRGGVGLGLAIVADTIQRHRGTVQVESIPGRGSSFTVKLPLQEDTEYKSS